MPSRPPAQPLPTASSSSIIHPLRHDSVRLFPLFAQLPFHIIPAKLDGELAKVYSWVEELSGRCVSVEESSFVVTALKGRARLERILGRKTMNTKRIVSTDFIHETYNLALEALVKDTKVAPSLPPWKPHLVVQPAGPSRPTMIDSDSDSDVQEVDSQSQPRKRRRLNHSGNGDGPVGIPASVFAQGVEGPPIRGSRDLSPFAEDMAFGDIPKRCVQRASPLICVNQDLIDAIRPIYEDREFEELDQKNSNVLSYRRSMSILKSLPRRIKSGKEARKLIDVGEKVAQRIDEFLETGQIAESLQILASDKYRILREFSSVYTVGHHKARELYDRYHCRTLEDVRQHYMGIAEESEELRLKEKMRRRQRGGMTNVDIVEEWMRIKDDLDSKISRDEVLEIRDCVMEHLNVLMEGCEMTITGGFRRGKTSSNDVDLVFCPPEGGEDIGLLKNLYLRLSAFGIITHVLHVTHRSAEQPIKASAQNFDNLDKAFIIFRLPGPKSGKSGSGGEAGGGGERRHRRVDLISAPRERYAAAVLSWSGSMMFERDLKRWAEDRGYKFRARIIEINTGREIHLETEREIFDFLGLRFVPPHLRNADG